MGEQARGVGDASITMSATTGLHMQRSKTMGTAGGDEIEKNQQMQMGKQSSISSKQLPKPGGLPDRGRASVTTDAAAANEKGELPSRKSATSRGSAIAKLGGRLSMRGQQSTTDVSVGRKSISKDLA